MISREEALKFLNEKIENKNIIKHMLAAEAVMRALGRKLKTQMSNVKTDEEINEDEWAMAGLLHDGDYSLEVPVERQGIQITEWLRGKGYEVPENVAQTMAAHNWSNNGVAPVSLMEWSLFCADSLTGLIVATALVMQDKKLTSVRIESVFKKFTDPSFARGTRREDIKKCEEKLRIALQEFVEVGLRAMQEIAPQLGL